MNNKNSKGKANDNNKSKAGAKQQPKANQGNTQSTKQNLIPPNTKSTPQKNLSNNKPLAPKQGRNNKLEPLSALTEESKVSTLEVQKSSDFIKNFNYSPSDPLQYSDNEISSYLNKLQEINRKRDQLYKNSQIVQHGPHIRKGTHDNKEYIMNSEEVKLLNIEENEILNKVQGMFKDTREMIIYLVVCRNEQNNKYPNDEYYEDHKKLMQEIEEYKITVQTKEKEIINITENRNKFESASISMQNQLEEKIALSENQIKDLKQKIELLESTSSRKELDCKENIICQEPAKDSQEIINSVLNDLKCCEEKLKISEVKTDDLERKLIEEKMYAESISIDLNHKIKELSQLELRIKELEDLTEAQNIKNTNLSKELLEKDSKIKTLETDLKGYQKKFNSSNINFNHNLRISSQRSRDISPIYSKNTNKPAIDQFTSSQERILINLKSFEPEFQDPLLSSIRSSGSRDFETEINNELARIKLCLVSAEEKMKKMNERQSSPKIEFPTEHSSRTGKDIIPTNKAHEITKNIENYEKMFEIKVGMLLEEFNSLKNNYDELQLKGFMAKDYLEDLENENKVLIEEISSLKAYAFQLERENTQSRIFLERINKQISC